MKGVYFVKKVIVFSSILILLFTGILAINNYQQKEKLAGNPYQKNKLNQATIDQLDDPNYQNIILPDEMVQKIKDKESFTVYFYSPTCPHCQKTSPIIVPMASEMGIDLKLYNLLEFQEGWNQYQIEATPTVIYYENGKEVDRIVGTNAPEVFQSWFNKHQ